MLLLPASCASPSEELPLLPLKPIQEQDINRGREVPFLHGPCLGILLAVGKLLRLPQPLIIAIASQCMVHVPGLNRRHLSHHCLT